MDGIRLYESALKASKVQLKLMEGLDHPQEFSEIDRVLPTMLAFIRA
jgi:hypothetical protein